MKKLLLLILTLSPFLLKAQPRLVKSISESTNFTSLNNTTLFYTSTDSLWKTDGVASSFIKTGLINPGQFKAVGNNLFFTNNTNEFWVYNNSDNTFTNLKSFNSLDYLNTIGTILFFVGDDGTTGRELWKTDGTVNGTVLVKDINPGAANGFPDFLPFTQTRSLTTYNTPVLNNEIYFAATNGTNGMEPWKSNGTDAGTVMIVNLNSTGDSNPKELTSSQNAIFFIAQDENSTFFLNKTDGTAAGTTLIKEFSSEFCGCTASNIDNVNSLRYINNLLYFSIEFRPDPITIIGKSDGTSEGTTVTYTDWVKIWDFQLIDNKIITNLVDEGSQQNIRTLNPTDLSLTLKYQSKIPQTEFAWVPFTFLDTLIYFGDDWNKDDEIGEFEVCYFNTKTEKVTFIKDLYPNLLFNNPADGGFYNFTVVDKSLFFTSNGKLWVINPNDLQVTSINQSNDNSSSFTVYPNPFEDKITINSANQNSRFTFKIMDLIGNSYYELQPKDNVIDVSSLNLQQGMYLIKVSDENDEEQIIRLMKK